MQARQPKKKLAEEKSPIKTGQLWREKGGAG